MVVMGEREGWWRWEKGRDGGDGREEGMVVMGEREGWW